MNQVVNFLSLLAVTEEQGGVKRMLHVCAEFERIARIVLDKTEKDSTRKKRRSGKISTDAGTQNNLSTPQQAPENRSGGPMTPQSNNSNNKATNNMPTPQTLFSPNFRSGLLGNNDPPDFNSNIQGFSPSLSNMNIPLDFGNTGNNGSGQEYQGQDTSALPDGMDGNGNGNSTAFDSGDMSQFSMDNANPASPLNVGAFEQPFVPQAFWQMPMTLEWDLLDMPNMTGLDSGVSVDGVSDQNQNQNQN